MLPVDCLNRSQRVGLLQPRETSIRHTGRYATGLYETPFMIFPVGVLVTLHLILMELREIRGSLRVLVAKAQRED